MQNALDTSKKGISLYLAAALLLVYLVHTSYLGNGFTWLDHGDIERGRTIVPLSYLPTAIKSRFGQTGFFRPIVTIINSLDFALFGLWPKGYHHTNVLLHLAVAFISAQFIGLFFSLNVVEKILVVLVVGLHPIAALAVGVISYRQELLVAFFSYTAVYFHIQTRKTGLPKYIVWASLSFLAALLSKETALFLVPALIVLWELKEKRRNFSLFLSELFAIIIYVLLRLHAIPELWRTSSLHLTWQEALGTRVTTIGKLLLQLLSPFQPTFSDVTAIVPITQFSTLLTAIIFLLSIIAIIRFGLGSTWSKAMALLAITLIPAFNIVPLARFYSPHYGYLALPGLATLAILLLRKCPLNNFSGNIFSLTFALWIAIMAVSTYRAGFRFDSDLTLFGPEVARDDRFAEGHQYLGDYYFKLKDYERAGFHYQRALDDDPATIAFVDRGSVTNNLAGVFLAQNRIDEADQLLIELSSKEGWDNNPTLLYNRALIADKRGNFGQVVVILNREDISWSRPQPLLLLAKALRELGRNEEATDTLQKIH